MTPEQFDAILADMAAGMATYKAMQAHGSNYRAFYGQLASNAEARERYARAKADGLDVLADEILELADTPRVGVKTMTKPDGAVETVKGDMIERSRLQVDSRKWLLSKLAPKKYGDRLDVEHGGNINVTVKRFSTKDSDGDA